MSPTPAMNRALVVTMTAMSQINDDLTIITNACDELDQFEASVEIRQAAQRIIWQVVGLSNYCNRRGGRASNVGVERLITEDRG